MIMLRNARSALATMALTLPTLLSACGDDAGKASAKPADASTGTDARTPDAGPVADSGTFDAGGGSDGGALGASCPADLVCVSPSGRYVCAKAGPEVITCNSAADCPSGLPMCYPLAGQGICLHLCAPPEGLPKETSVSGVLVEYKAGTGPTGASETPREKALEGVKVCIEAPAELKTQVGCTTTDANGKFTLSKLPPNRNAAMTINGLLSFHKDGYLPMVQSFGLGDGSQTLGNDIRLLTVADATKIASAVGAKLPDATTGWILATATKFNIGGPEGPYTYKQGTLKLKAQDDVTLSAAPPAGIGPLYTDQDELVAAVATSVDAGVADAGMGNGDAAADAGVPAVRAGKTSVSGQAFFLDLPAGAMGTTYQVTFTHPTLNCGVPIQAAAIPGYLTAAVTTACGNGVK